MDVLKAHAIFAQREDRSVLDYDAIIELPGGEADCWPALAVAAVDMAGMLDDAETEDDLLEGLRHFDYLRREGIASVEEWSWAAASVVDTVMAYCAQVERYVN